MNEEIEELEWQAFVAEKIAKDSKEYHLLCSQFSNKLSLPQNISWNQIFTWCYETIGERTIEWDYLGGYMFFADEKHMALFVLKWTQ